MGESHNGRLVSLRAWDYGSYWKVKISCVEPLNPDAGDWDEKEVRFYEKIPVATEPIDQAWIVLVYAIKQLEFEGAGGRSGGMEFPALF